MDVVEIHMPNVFKIWLLARRSERGQDLAEYALLIGLIALIVILAITLLGDQISLVFSVIGNNISNW